VSGQTLAKRAAVLGFTLFGLAACTKLIFHLSGTVEGLVGTGLILSDGTSELAIAGNGAFTFPAGLEEGKKYDVTVIAAPSSPRQTCTVSQGNGTIERQVPPPAAVVCATERFSVGGTVTGLRGTGLVLTNNGADPLPIAANGEFKFSTPLDDLSAFEVAVLTQPSGPDQTCAVSVAGVPKLTGANALAVSVRCGFALGGTVTNLLGTGLLLRVNGGETVSPTGDGAFAFPTPLDDGEVYQVEVTSQPTAPAELCELEDATGTVAGQPVRSVKVTCRAPGNLRITELGGCFYATTSCWLEVHNTSPGAPEELALYQLRTTAAKRISPFTPEPSHRFVLPRHTVAPGEYLLVRALPDNNHFDGPHAFHLVDGEVIPWWNISGFAELTSGGTSADFVRWGYSAEPPSPGGHWNGIAAVAMPFGPAAYGTALVRDLALTDTDTAADWRLGDFGTPGGRNDITSDVDNDGDGVPDQAEVQGGTYAGLDLYALGARTGQVDIFVEVQHLDSADVGVVPQPAALEKVKSVFLTRGYSLHFDVAAQPLTFQRCTMFGAQADCSNIYAVKAASMDLRRYPVFHYMLFAYSQLASGAVGASGRAEAPGNDALITLGNWGLNADSPAASNALVNFQAATVMHELGHNLGLRHGGDNDTNDQPNYLSAMNYTYCIYGLPTPGSSEGDRFYFFQSLRGNACGGIDALSKLQHSPLEDPALFRLDFSDGFGATIDEESVDEMGGLGRTGGVAVDFNCNASIDNGYRRDINLDTFPGPLRDYDDWGHLVLPFRRTALGDSQGPPAPARHFIDAVTRDRQSVADEEAPPPSLLRAISRIGRQ
jgi:hypothetical protein